MTARRSKQVRPHATRARILGPASLRGIPSPPSLPPEVTATSSVSPVSLPVGVVVCANGHRTDAGRRVCPYCYVKLVKVKAHADQPAWYLPPDSKIRTTAMQIIAMRIAGMEEEAIAGALGISARSISAYLYRAGKNGWLNIDSPRDQLEYGVVHKVVRNIDAMLDSDDPEVRQAVTMETAKGTIFKSFGETAAALPASTLVAIRIEMPPGVPQGIREETMGGRPAYLEGAVVEKGEG